LPNVRFAPEAVIRALTEYSRSGGPFCKLKSWTPGKARPWKKRSSDWAVSWLRLKVTPPRPNDPDYERWSAFANGGANFPIRSRGGENTGAAGIEAKSRVNKPGRLQW
jgi:hypothetical protein